MYNTSTHNNTCESLMSSLTIPLCDAKPHELQSVVELTVWSLMGNPLLPLPTQMCCNSINDQ